MTSSRPLIELELDLAKGAKTLEAVSREGQALIKDGMVDLANKGAAEIKRRGDTDIKRGGNFSGRWTNAFTVDQDRGNDRIGMSLFFRGIPYGHVHELGAVIRGRPLLWIPLPWNPHKVRAREYPGQLFRVNRVGKNPLLFSSEGARYVGVEQVTLRPRWHLRAIASNVVKTEFARYFYDFIQARQGGLSRRSD